MAIEAPSNYYIPTVTDTTHRGETRYDIWSRLLIDRIIFLGTPIDDTIANLIIAQLLYLESQDPQKHIFMYVNTPRGVITAGTVVRQALSSASATSVDWVVSPKITAAELRALNPKVIRLMIRR